MQFGLETLINQQKPKMEVIGNSTSCTDALSDVKHLSADVIVLDLNHDSGEEMTAVLHLISSTTAKVLFFKWSDDTEIYDKAILAGAKGIIEKEAGLETILKAIEKIHEGQVWLNQGTIERLINQLSQQKFKSGDIQAKYGVDKLTPKEKKVFFTMIENVGIPAKVVASKLHISESTLRNHLTAIYEKLEVNSRLELWSYVHKHKLK
ncbi:MAG: response regulator transcription factor [Nitrosomonas sp.]|uniref:LuxR C-terminal-related transcriptional regulator n=1 Tax=Nitrosomonas sp. JL21 TaxID=153949 RepID=UPI001369B8AA|nr:response regulator transcription factor [Nitrosomonas sp.]MCC7091152.1 response regulator transcription factor [Nitrosomonas sp.]